MVETQVHSRIRKTIVLVVIAIMSAMLLCACNRASNIKMETKAKNSFGETLVVATDDDYWPFVYYNDKKELVGHDIELINTIANELQMNLEIKPMTWSESLEAVKKGEADAVLTCEYGDALLPGDAIVLSSPMQADDFMVFSKEKLKKTEQLYGLKIGVTENANALVSIRAHGFEPFCVTYNSNKAAFNALMNDECDCVVCRYVVGVGIIDEMSDIAGIEIKPCFSLSDSNMAIGVSANNPELLNRINLTIEKLRADGVLDDLNDKWLFSYIPTSPIIDMINERPIMSTIILMCLLAVAILIITRIVILRQEGIYLRALSKDYDSVDLVNIKGRNTYDFVYRRTLVKDELKNLVDEKWLKEQNITERIKLMALMVDPADQDDFYTMTRKSKVLESFARGKTHTVEFRLGKGENTLHFREEFIPIKNFKGKVNTMVVCIRSIEDLYQLEAAHRKQLEDKNKELESALSDSKRLQESLENYKNAIITESIISLEANLSKNILVYGEWKGDDGELRPLHDILGLDLPCEYDVYIEKWRKKFVDESSSEIFAKSTDRNNLLTSFNNNRTEMTFDYEADTIDGNRRFLRRSICMIRNSEGDVISFTTVKDISEIGRVREQETALLRTISDDFDSVDIITLSDNKQNDTITRRHKITDSFANVVTNAWLNETNLSKRLDIMIQYLEPEDREAFYNETRREVIYDNFYNDEIHSVNFRLKINGEDSFYQERFIPILGKNKEVMGMLVCIRCTDSEIKKELGHRQELETAMRAAEKADKAKTTFLFNMSHDIRTPMNAILGYAAIASKKTSIDEIKDYLAKIGIAGNQLLSLVNQVLEMSRIESGKIILQDQKIDFVENLNVLHAVYYEHAKSSDIDFSVEINDVKHLHAIGDNDRMTQIANNLISNAVKYTPAGGSVKVILDEAPCLKPGYGLYKFTIEDTGLGMSEEYLPHLFEEFTREENSTVRKIQGTGLGMPIVKRLVDLMEGSIDVTSKLGEGTKFVVSIPLRIDKEYKEDSKHDEKSIDVSLKGMKILLVEDNEMNREIAQEILTDFGAEIDTAEDGVIAVEKVKSSKPGDDDIVLMDVQMPRMDGYEATKQIRALSNKKLAGIHIVAMTANAFAEDKQNALDAGMDGHLAKPIDVNKLLTTLQELMATD